MSTGPVAHTGLVHEVIEPPADAAHRARPGDRRLRLLAAVAGVTAAIVAIGLGTTALMRSPATVTSTITTANLITVTVPPAVVPLSDRQIADLLRTPPDFGALGEPTRRTSCLAGLGYPATAPILGATPVQINNRPAVLLVLDGDRADLITALAVAPNCSSAGTGLLADTAVPRP